ncbi:cytosine-specific methyltransferase [Enterococcus thailandicus]|uniref:DNA cytosine methyltransferase n=1 Tax=Enterococcus thailandicus TaxID=417368 RepID=UPI00244D84F9|nr:DNA cytosine methyltransferase [Enterococcus thailandicus]GMC03606.1 cytosine-specific methyltransferase [Enterococcus thailandicus]GMC10251.1 cytosine-specific methyltransferase [Enterococcus thailandicus]
MENSVSSSVESKRTIAAFFSGVGGIELGFTSTGKFRVMYANEFDRNAIITYRENYPDTLLDERDIHEVTKCIDRVPDTDLIMGGFPCQAFSIAGYRKGFEDERGDLFFELLKIINEKKPEAIFVENVKNMVTHDHGNTFKVIREALVMSNYFIKWKVLNGKDYGNVPQNRERIYIVGFKSKKAYESFNFPEKTSLTNKLDSVIDFNLDADERYYYDEIKTPFWDKLYPNITSQDTVYQWRRQYVRENKSGVVPTLTANMGTGGHNVPLILTNDGRIRKLTPKETFNVQGFPADFKLPNISNGQLYKQAGNSVVVPVIQRIAEKIDEALEKSDKIIKVIPNGKYFIMHTIMDGRFSGRSELVRTVDSERELKQFEKEHNITFMSRDEYLRNVQKNRKMDFYNFE